MTGNRVKLGVWFVSEDRDRVYDGSTEVDNPLRERTRIRIPLLTLDVRITEQFGVQAAASLPDVTRTAVVPRAAGPVDFKETFQGTPVLVGGGNWVYLTPGLAAQVGKGVNVQAEVKLPVLRSLANRQLDSPAVFQFGISRAF